MMLPNLSRIGKAVLRPARAADLVRPPGRVHRFAHVGDVAEQHRHIGQDVSCRSPSRDGAAGTHKARAAEINTSNLVFRGQLHGIFVRAAEMGPPTSVTAVRNLRANMRLLPQTKSRKT
jgi:hypothetical protein